MGRERVGVVLLSAALGAAAAVACNDTTSGKAAVIGDELIVDVEASVQADPPAQDGAIPPLDPGVDGGGSGYAAYASDAYTPAAWCSRCACAAGSYCFGGATNYTAFDGVCDHVEAGAGAALAIGCNAPPAGCDASDCICLMKALAPEMPCYGECAGAGATPWVYCAIP